MVHTTNALALFVLIAPLSSLFLLPRNENLAAPWTAAPGSGGPDGARAAKRPGGGSASRRWAVGCCNGILHSVRRRGWHRPRLSRVRHSTPHSPPWCGYAVRP